MKVGRAGRGRDIIVLESEKEWTTETWEDYKRGKSPLEIGGYGIKVRRVMWLCVFTSHVHPSASGNRLRTEFN